MPGGKRDKAAEAHMEEEDKGDPLMDNAMAQMLRCLMEEQRKADLAREEARAAQQAALEEVRVAQQTAMEVRMLEQQKELLKYQHELGEKVTVAQRESHDRERKRDRALGSIPVYREGEDLEEFLNTAEHRLRVAEIPEGEWSNALDVKFSGKVSVSWRDITVSLPAYRDAKVKLLRSCGYTPKVASDSFFSFRAENCKGLTGDQLYTRGQQLLRRIVAPERLTEKSEFSIVKGWIHSVVPRKARVALDGRAVEDAVELVTALQDFLSLEGEKGEGQVATFRKSLGEMRERSPQVNCFKCGRSGHKAADCWGTKGSSHAGYKPPVASTEGNVRNGTSNKIICYTCGVEGHKSPQCPKKPEVLGKEIKVKPVKRLSRKRDKCVRMDGIVNGKEVSIVMDSGASMSVVPESFVTSKDLTGERVAVSGVFKVEEVPVASVSFEIGNWKWMEEVAVAPLREDSVNEVIYGVNLKSRRDRDLVDSIEVDDPNIEVSRVSTRSMTANEAEQETKDAITIAKERPIVKLCNVNRQASENMDDSKQDDLVVGLECGSNDLCIDAEEDESILGIEKEPSVAGAGKESELEVEEYFELRKESREEPDLVIPCVREGSKCRERLNLESKNDPTLERWRNLAALGEQGLVWREELLFRSKLTHTSEKVYVLVLPKSFRRQVLEVAHEGLQHLGARRVKSLVAQRFDWPGLGVDVINHVRSCDTCQKCNKTQKKVPMVARKVLTEPFESMGVDIVGPFPKGKGGCRFLLTGICLASKWPEAIPLKTITAKAVANGLMEMFSRTGIPLELLSDQGAQFIGKVVSQLCKSLRIEKIRTTPYHPETNGTVERLHSTLGAMLSKASSQNLDWVGQIPFALFALRAAPNRETGFSPFELAFGRRVRTPLDILHQGWVNQEFKELDTDEWAGWLVDRLQVWHSIMKERGDQAVEKRKDYFDRKAVARTLNAGDLVLCRVPGMAPKLSESWHGPYRVLEKVNQVDYRVEFEKKRSKVLHINNLKLYLVREVAVLRVALVAEDFSEDECVRMKMDGYCEDFNREELPLLLEEFPDVISDIPGRTGVTALSIETGSCSPLASKPYRVPDVLKGDVREEVSKLVDLGVVIESVSPWASPIVPVPKDDGSLRLCVDYRRLNAVTQGDPYYMSTLDEILERVGPSRCLSKLDLSKGFYQIPVEEGSIDKTAFITPFGKYAFTRMPFGLRNAPSIFQRTMEIVLRGCYQFAAPYIDDVVVYSGNGSEHLVHLRLVLEAFRLHGLTVKLGKCSFGRRRLEYLGHMIGDGQLAVPEHRAKAMAQYLQPRTKKELRAFLGAASYYRRFVCNFASFSSRLSPYTSKKSPSVVLWDDVMLEAFQTLRVSLVDVCTLTVPSSEDVFVLHTDASGAGIGATLNVIRDGVELPVAFYSKQLQGAQHRYSATELEGLAVFKSINFFAHFLWGKHFEVITDHSALVQLLKSKTLNNRLHGWSLQLMSFDFTISYRPGSCNQDADALSRQAWEQVRIRDAVDESTRTSQHSLLGGDVGITPLEVQSAGCKPSRM